MSTSTRRRFLCICATMLAPSLAHAHIPRRWRGRALGANADITLHGPQKAVSRAFARIGPMLREIEALFSLHSPGSALSQLNRHGFLDAPPAFLRMMRLSDLLFEASGGLFDPSIQPLWADLTQGHDGKKARQHVGWRQLRTHGSSIRLGTGQALSFNGIAQGAATDRAVRILQEEGFTATLVNIGEYRAGDGHWRVGLHDPDHGLVDTIALTNAAVATSSPSAMRIGRDSLSHILHPFRAAAQPRWSSVCVEAPEAALADGLSTALCLADENECAAIARRLSVPIRIRLVDASGRVTLTDSRF